jgi:hypothetical protein
MNSSVVLELEKRLDVFGALLIVINSCVLNFECNKVPSRIEPTSTLQYYHHQTQLIPSDRSLPPLSKSLSTHNLHNFCIDLVYVAKTVKCFISLMVTCFATNVSSSGQS